MSPNKHKKTVLFIVGPTAIGKTSLSIELAKKIGAEIVSCDSMQIYKKMRILNQAPSKKYRTFVKHHLVEKLDPREEYSVAEFIKEASGAIEKILKKKKTPIVVGGSGLYVKSLVDGLFMSPEADEVFRKKMASFAKRCGKVKLHRRLFKIDPVSAGRIHPNDIRRVIRALEIYDSTGKTMTELRSQTKGLKDRYRIKIFGLNMGRENIYSAIDLRVDRMFEEGLIEEVKRLLRSKVSKTAGLALGVKEVAGFLKKEYDIDQAKYLLKRNTRHFAKRQLAWFRADKRIRWFDVKRLSRKEIISKIVKQLGKG